MLDTFNSVGSEVEALLKSGTPQAISRKLEDIEQEHITWLWTGFIPNKKLVIIDGMPGVGKSTLTAEIAAKVSRGIPFPCGTVYEARSVAFIAVEDGMADSTNQDFNLHPRFGHTSRIHLQMWVVRDSNPRPSH